MKLSLTTLALLSTLALAEPPPPPAPGNPPPPAPATPAPAAPADAPPGEAPLLPPAGGAVDTSDGFATEKERQSYALGQHFVTREKNNAAANGTDLPKADDMVAGMTDVLKAAKSRDYAMGASLALQIMQAGMEADPEAIAASVRSSLAGEASKLTPAQQQAAMQRIQSELMGKRDAKKKADLDKALATANEFLDANGKKEGVLKTASGVQYKIEKEGEGKPAAATDIVTMHFKGTLLDGSTFEKSQEKGPGKKPMRILPQGLQEILQVLKAGTKATVWLPPAQGFGEAGRAVPPVKPNQVLIYEVEFIESAPLPKPPTPGGPVPTGAAPITATTPPISVEMPATPPKGTPAPATTPPVEVPATPGGAPATPPAPAPEPGK